MKKLILTALLCATIINPANAFVSKYQDKVEEPEDVIFAECDEKVEDNERRNTICLCTYHVFQAKQHGFMNTLRFLENSNEKEFYNVLNSSIVKCEKDTRNMKTGIVEEERW